MATFYEDLVAAGLPVQSADENGAVNWIPGTTLTPEQTNAYINVAAAHFGGSVVTMKNIRDRQLAAKVTAGNIPNWATWTQQQLLDWWNTNLADSIVDGFSVPAGVKAMLKAQNAAILRIAQLEIALRDEIWPDLPE